jgi:hypothetical protein
MSARLNDDAKKFLCKHWAAVYLTIEEMEIMLQKDIWNVMETAGMGSALAECLGIDIWTFMVIQWIRVKTLSGKTRRKR